MAKRGRIVQYTADELREMRRRGGDRTDLSRVDAMTEEELEAAIASDDEGEFDWEHVSVEIPGPKQQLTVRFDRDIVDWFKSQGSGYQTRMNAVLRRYVEAHSR